jgi:hypothetical protein
MAEASLPFPPSPRGAPPPPTSTLAATPAAPRPAPPRLLHHLLPISSAAPFFPSGRSKAQWWEDASPSAASSEGRPSPPQRPSFRDVVIGQPAPVEQGLTRESPPQRLVLVIGHSLLSFPKAGGEWHQVVSRRVRRRRLLQDRPPRRRFPEHLRGKCINCFSGNHRAAGCCRPTCCFRCFEPGHHSCDCPRRLTALRQHRFPPRWHRRVAWCPAAAPPQMTATPPSEADRRPPPSAPLFDRCPRRQCRRPSASSDSASRGSSPLPPGVERARHVQEAGSEPQPQQARPLCVIDRSAEIDKVEARLRCALFASVGGAHPAVSPQQVQQAISSSFNIAEDGLSVATSEPDDFVIFLPDSPSTDKVFNGGALLHAPGFSLFFRRWTRVAHGEATALPAFVHGTAAPRASLLGVGSSSGH